MTIHLSLECFLNNPSGLRLTFPLEFSAWRAFTATEYSLIWRMLDFLGFPGLALYLILGKTAVNLYNYDYDPAPQLATLLQTLPFPTTVETIRRNHSGSGIFAMT